MGFPWALLLHAKFILSEWLSLVVIIPFSALPNSSSRSREKLFKFFFLYFFQSYTFICYLFHRLYAI